MPEILNTKRYKLDKNVFTLGLVSLFTDISSQMIYPLLPIFLSSVLGVGVAFIGLLEGIAEASASILKVLSGWYSDKLKKRK
ncbi:MAG: MFS transporter, partial [Candidatus Omnitrophica bacterium]|nr:MFS transporter [Candidatus Omnitrophota bacterium]